MPERSNESPAQEDLHLTRSEHFVKFYANNVQVETSIWDCRLIVGELNRAEGRNSVEQLVSIVMSPQHAKALVGVLGSQLKGYEDRFGVIRLEPSDTSASSAGQTPKAEKK